MMASISKKSVLSHKPSTHLPPVHPLENIPQRVAYALKKREGKKLVNILDPPCRQPKSIELPPVNDRRKEVHTEIPAEKSSSEIVFLKVPHVEGDEEGNPFRIPQDIFKFNQEWDEEIQNQRDQEEGVSAKKKETSSFKQAQTVLRRIKPFLERTSKMTKEDPQQRVLWRAQHGLQITHLQKVSKNTHAEYIRQRRNMFYLYRAIRIRKEALKLLKEKKFTEESKIKEFEWLTAFTKDAFETFLRENDDATFAATRAAQGALKEKLEKSLNMRNLNIEINSLKSEISVINESLKECKSYMKFLDDIAREIMRKDEEEQNRTQRREQQIKEELVKYMKQGLTLKQAQHMVDRKAKEFSEDYHHGFRANSLDTGGSADFIHTLNMQIHRDDDGDGTYIDEYGEVQELPPPPLAFMKPTGDETQEKRKSITSKGRCLEEPTMPNTFEVPPIHKHDIGPTAAPTTFNFQDDEKIDDDDDGFNEETLLASLELVDGDEHSDKRELANMSFTRPSQLLQIYSDMEEANLSLIQHCQSSEEHLERLNTQILHTRQEMNRRGRLLRTEINSVQQNIEQQEERANALSNLIQIFTGGNYDVRQQQKLYRILRRHVAKVYRTAVGNVDHHLNPIMMLTSIEKNFEDLMREIENMPGDVVLQISRELDKERREMERMEKMHQRQMIHNDRKSRSIERAKAPIKQKKGRPLVARSRPPKVVIHLAQAELDKKAEMDEFNYFFGE